MGFYIALLNGANTVNLSSYVMEDSYYPAVESANVPTVTESCRLRLLGDISANRTIMQDIGEVANNAARWAERRTESRVYLRMKWKVGDTEYQSPIRSIRIVPSSRIFAHEQTNQQKSSVFDLTWERDNYWEYPFTPRTNGIAPNGVDGWVKEIPGLYDINGSNVYSIYNSLRYIVGEETIATGDGGTLAFSGTTTNVPIHTTTPPTLSWNGGAKVVQGVNSAITGNINFSGADVNGSVNPTTGAWTFTFTVAPAAQAIKLTPLVYGYGNWLTIPNSSSSWTSENDLPVPVGFSLWNADTTLQNQIIYAGGISGYGHDVDLQYEGESTTAVAGTSTVADATCSAGNRIDHTFSNSSEAIIASWAVTRSDVEKMGGRWFIPIIRFTGAANTGDINNIRYRWAIQDSTGTYYWWKGEQYRPDTSLSQNLVPVGSVRLPPWDVPMTVLGVSDTQTALTLVLLGQRIDSTSRTASIDYVFLMPADSFVKITTMGRGANEDEKIIDVPPYNATMVSDASSVHYAVIREFGSLRAYPGQNNRYFFLWHGDGNYQSDVDWRMIAELSIFPRKRSL